LYKKDTTNSSFFTWEDECYKLLSSRVSVFHLSADRGRYRGRGRHKRIDPDSLSSRCSDDADCLHGEGFPSSDPDHRDVGRRDVHSAHYDAATHYNTTAYNHHRSAEGSK